MRRYLRVRDNYWYYFHTTISVLAAILCFVIVLAGGIMTFVHNKTALQIAPLCVIVSHSACPRGSTAQWLIGLPQCCVFVFGTLILKAYKYWQNEHFRFKVDLRDRDALDKLFMDLEAKRTANSENLERPKLAICDLFGIIDSEQVKRAIRRKS